MINETSVLRALNEVTDTLYEIYNAFKNGSGGVPMSDVKATLDRASAALNSSFREGEFPDKEALEEVFVYIVTALGDKQVASPASMTPHEVAILNRCTSVLRVAHLRKIFPYIDFDQAEHLEREFNKFCKPGANCNPGKCPLCKDISTTIGKVECFARWLKEREEK